MNAFEDGYKANSIYQNPYWLNYPKQTIDEEVIKARQLVDGYVHQIIDKRNNVYE